MKKTAITLILGLSLAMAGFAQSAAKPKGRPNPAKPAASSKSKLPKPKAPGRASGPTVIKAKPQPSQLMMALDANEDGKLSLKEIEAAVKALKQLDENNDGELTLNEFGPAPELTKPSRGDGTSAKGGASTAKASPRRVAKKAPARKVSKAALTADPEIKTLIDETATVTELIRKATPRIKNLAKKQAAQNWARRGSRAFLRSLNNIQSQDKAVKLVKAKQKLEEVRKLLE